MTSQFMKKDYSESRYDNIVDTRSQAQIVADHHFVELLTETNLKALNIKMTEKKKVNYESREAFKVDLEQGWFCYITDSKSKVDWTILTVHGAPGDHREWVGLQTEVGDVCRWINLTIPGFDGIDQRRGNYDGSVQHLSRLIIRLLEKLQIDKIVYCGHSLGSIFGTYFINKYRQYVSGYINITGIVDIWYTGLLVFFNTAIGHFGYNTSQYKKEKVYDQDEFRVAAHRRFLQYADGNSFGPVQFPKLTLTEYFGYAKLINSFPNGLSEMFEVNQRLPIFQVLIFGKKDPLHEHHKTQATISRICQKNPSYIFQPYYQRLFTMASRQISDSLLKQFSLKIDASKLQSYFCYHLQDTGHNAHKRRPKQMSQIIQVYLVCVNILSRYEQLLISKL